MRDLAEIDRDIERIVDCLSTLMVERRLVEKILAGYQASAEILSEKAIERVKDKGWEPGL
jgi:hypothetical protein